MGKEPTVVSKSVEIGGRPLQFEVGRFAEQANAAVLGRYGDTLLLVTVVAGSQREDVDYVPLQVEYQEKLYAGGRIKGSRWVKREGRPSDEAILNARLVDRGLRPLFPKGYRVDTQVIITVLSVDAENDPDMVAINTASAALAISDIPWNGPIAAVRVGYIPKDKNHQGQENQGNQEASGGSGTTNQLDTKHFPAAVSTKEGFFLINPTYLEREYSDLDLVVAAMHDALLMVEAGANEIPEATVVQALDLAQREANQVIETIESLKRAVGKPTRASTTQPEDRQLRQTVLEKSRPFLATLEKTATEAETIDLESLTAAIIEDQPQLSPVRVKETLLALVKETIRKRILTSGKRPDSRKPEEIREVSAEVGILPRTHGSAMFKRGKTQALTITTLAAPSLEQWIETMEGEGTKRYMHHYYMPPFSVGEVGRLGWPSRREIGHGALAERSLEPMIPQEEEFPYTIRVVSEILSSNGSTSMASVCGSTLSLMDAGVPLKKPVAGIAMGLVAELEKRGSKITRSVILSDIQGIEDHVGDMDFKVAGTKDGITALQMDVKIQGVTTAILKQALAQAHTGRLLILEKMLQALPAPRAQLSRYAPKVEVVRIAKDQIGEVIGPGGRVIRQIIAETGAQIDVDDDGRVTVSGTDQESITRASERIRSLTHKIQVGEEFEGTVKRIEPFGVFVEILPGKDGLVHVSRLSTRYVSDPGQIVRLGDKLKVVVSEIDDLGRINLSIPGVQRTEPNRWSRPDRRDRHPHRPHRR